MRQRGGGGSGTLLGACRASRVRGSGVFWTAVGRVVRENVRRECIDVSREERGLGAYVQEAYWRGRRSCLALWAQDGQAN